MRTNRVTHVNPGSSARGRQESRCGCRCRYSWMASWSVYLIVRLDAKTASTSFSNACEKLGSAPGDSSAPYVPKLDPAQLHRESRRANALCDRRSPAGAGARNRPATGPSQGELAEVGFRNGVCHKLPQRRAKSPMNGPCYRVKRMRFHRGAQRPSRALRASSSVHQPSRGQKGKQ